MVDPRTKSVFPLNNKVTQSEVKEIRYEARIKTVEMYPTECRQSRLTVLALTLMVEYPGACRRGSLPSWPPFQKSPLPAARVMSG